VTADTVCPVIEVPGLNGESLVYDGATVTKFRHHGKDEAARNPVSTYREVQVKHKEGKRGKDGRYDVLLAMSSFMALSVPESGKPALDELIAALDATRAG
jgi:hypothetical protein